MSRAKLRAIILVIGLALVPRVGAQAQDIPASFIIEAMPVDETANTAAEARDRALIRAQSMAFARLVARLVPLTERNKVPNLAGPRLADLIESIEIQDERRSAVRYLAAITTRFRPDRVRAVFRAAGVPFAETRSRPLIVVPVLRGEDQSVLWEETNAWLAAWRELPAVDSLLPLVVPTGDLTDIAELDADQVLAGDEAALMRLAARHGASGALVVVATAQAGEGQAVVVTVAATRFDGEDADTQVDAITGRVGESEEAVLARAAAQARSAAIERWKLDQVLNFEGVQRQNVTITLADLATWITIRARLGEITAIQDIELISLSRAEAVAAIEYLGDVQALRQALAQKEIRLAESEDGWRLMLLSARPAGRSAP